MNAHNDYNTQWEANSDSSSKSFVDPTEDDDGLGEVVREPKLNLSVSKMLLYA